VNALGAALAFASALACAAPLGCTLDEPRAPTTTRGEGIPTGNATYDGFFNSLRELRGQASAAPADAEAGHADLMKTLGLDGKAKANAALDEAGARAKKLQDKGVLMHLEIAPEPKVLVTRGKIEVGADGQALFKSIEGTIKTSLETRKRFASIVARAADLEKKRAELRDQVATTFKDETSDKRDQIVAELDAAKGLIADASDGAGRATGTESRFVVDLVYAVETGGGTRPEASKSQPPRKGGFTPSPRTAPPSNPPPSAPVAAPPKKKAKGGDDFEP
jgi:hypothetical protein